MASRNKTTRLSPGDLKEKQSRQLFQNCLPVDRCVETPTGDKFLDFDGYVMILDKSSGNTGKHFSYQLKSTKNKNKNYHDCKASFLNVCKENNLPVILVLVNLVTKIIYWEHISNFYTEHVLKLKRGQKTKKVKFSSTKTIEDSNGFIDKCYQICLDQELAVSQREQFEQNKAQGLISAEEKDPLITESKNKLRTALTDISSEDQQLKETEKQKGGNLVPKQHINIETIKNKFVETLSVDLANKFVCYQAFVYLLEPFYTDRRGEETRIKLRDILSITIDEENIILQRLETLGLIDRVAAMISIKDRDSAKGILNELLDKNEIDINQLLTIFLT